jgi:lipid-binding SYLF domain-containing protein
MKQKIIFTVGLCALTALPAFPVLAEPGSNLGGGRLSEAAGSPVSDSQPAAAPMDRPVTSNYDSTTVTTEPAAKDARAMMRGDRGQTVETMLDAAAETLRKFKIGEKKIPSSQLAKAQCIAVFPDVTEAALVVGGMKGNGVISCRGMDQQWSRLGFLKLTGASIGAQLGAKTSDLAILLMSDRAKEAVGKNNFTVGGDLSAAWGTYDAAATASVNTAGPDVLVFSSAQGLFAGASLTGSKISPDAESMETYYQAPVELNEVLRSFGIKSNPGATQHFLNQLPRAAVNS